MVKLIRCDAFSVRAHLADGGGQFGDDAHAVEGTPDEEHRDDEENGGQNVRDDGAVFAELPARVREFDGQLDRQQPEQRCELDDGVERDR